jgi:probable addiction module antidote protein
MSLETFPYDSASLLDTPEAVAAYLADAFASGDLGEIADALGVAARAHGMTELARKTGLSRTQLYASLSRSGRPELETVLKVTEALGVRLVAAPIKRPSGVPLAEVLAAMPDVGEDADFERVQGLSSD